MTKTPPLDFEIDRLTNSIENALTGEVFDTNIFKLFKSDAHLLHKNDWAFDWKKECATPGRGVFKLTASNNTKIIQCLLSIEDKQDHFFMHLLESAIFNRGKNKLYLGVAGNLVAYACKVSFEMGYEGFVAFDSKTELISHYEQTLGATHFKGLRMFLDTDSAQNLVSHYFK